MIVIITITVMSMIITITIYNTSNSNNMCMIDNSNSRSPQISPGDAGDPHLDPTLRVVAHEEGADNVQGPVQLINKQ